LDYTKDVASLDGSQQDILGVFIEAAVILPNQLFETHPAVEKGRVIWLVESPRFFRDPASGIHFHKKKLVLHRASMRAYEDRLRQAGHEVRYVPYDEAAGNRGLFDLLRDEKVSRVFMADAVDTLLEHSLIAAAERAGLKLIIMETPAFMTPMGVIREFFESGRHFSLTRFYIGQRKRFEILVRDGKPEGGKWSFDPQNRKRLPRGFSIPALPLPHSNRFTEEAKAYVDKLFPDHPGETSGFFYPVTHEDARSWLWAFLEQRLQHFGDFQDAICRDEPFLTHSLLSAPLNIGLLTPLQVVREALDFAEAHPKQVPFNALEGFIRQVLGWREFLRGSYVTRGDQQRNGNFWPHDRKLPASFYDGTTGIEPVDVIVTRLTQHAYAHHIERLMVLGNFMLLCEIDPNEVYRWFMELFIDAYDWVMVPNVYGMSQYADGGMITTKPYLSSSNYILKMSDFIRGPWCEAWDGLYWSFVHRHRDFFRTNPRLRMMASFLDRMGEQKLRFHLACAQGFLSRLQGDPEPNVTP
jgi:deoxyribodipyrimidine photolyase-related protein